MGAAGDDILHAVFREGSRQFFRQLQIEIFVSGAARGFSAAGFPGEHAPGNAGSVQNLFHGQGHVLPVRIEIQAATQPEKPFLFSVENRKLLAFDEFLARVLHDAPGIVRRALHGGKQLHDFFVRDAALADQAPPQVQDLASHVLDADRADVLAGSAGQALK